MISEENYQKFVVCKVEFDHMDSTYS